MAVWSDPVRWTALTRGDDCPICLRSRPNDVIAMLENSWVTAPESAPIAGYACLVLRRHAVELHDLAPEEASAFMRDAQRLSRAVARVTDAVKMNYEIHGNTLPHLHMHFFPRRRGDPFEDRAIDPRQVASPVYARDDYREYVDALTIALRDD